MADLQTVNLKLSYMETDMRDNYDSYSPKKKELCNKIALSSPDDIEALDKLLNEFIDCK